MPKLRVFFSFHYKADAWRAAQVRNIGVVEGNEPVSDNKWEEITAGRDDAIKKWIDDQMRDRSCIIVLIGSHTAGRKWINYEIMKCWRDGKGVFGIYIHRLKDRNGKQTSKGRNPFEELTVDDKPLSTFVEAYDPPYTDSKKVYEYISENLAFWVSVASCLGNLASLPTDHLVRQKMGGAAMNFFDVKQLPILPPSAYTAEHLLFIVPRVLELVHTSWDIKLFADDVWKSATQELRDAILKQWQDNRSETGGNSFELPHWAKAYPEITPTDPQILHSQFPIRQLAHFHPSNGTNPVEQSSAQSLTHTTQTSTVLIASNSVTSSIQPTLPKKNLRTSLIHLKKSMIHLILKATQSELKRAHSLVRLSVCLGKRRSVGMGSVRREGLCLRHGIDWEASDEHDF